LVEKRKRGRPSKPCTILSIRELTPEDIEFLYANLNTGGRPPNHSRNQSLLKCVGAALQQGKTARDGIRKWLREQDRSVDLPDLRREERQLARLRKKN